MNWRTTRRARQRPYAATEGALQPGCQRGHTRQLPHAGRVVEALRHQDLARTSKQRTPESTARERVLALLDRATAVVAMADEGGALFYANPAGRATLGLATDADPCGISLLECLAPGVRPRIAEVAIPAALAKGAWSGEGALLTRGGRAIDVSLMITTHRDEAGQLEGLSLLAQDRGTCTGTAESLRVARNELLRLSAQHMAIQENERRRIAADLHDGLGQSLGLVIMSLEKVSSLLRQGEPETAAECLDRLKPKVRGTLDELRRIAMNLRPAMLDSLGILATLSWHLREIETACPGISIERRIEVDETDVPTGLRTPIFRILQEAGSNAIRHGGADRISVSLGKAQGVLELVIEDNGRGFSPGTTTRNRRLKRGLGLQSMRERAELSCGVCEIRSAPGKGTRVCVRWPASLRGIDFDHAAVLESEVQALQNPHTPATAHARNLEMLHHLSVCVACIRSVKING